MFDLENAIKKWKRGLAASPTLEDGYQSELEAHLRDKITDLIAQGSDPETAFRDAGAALGKNEKIDAEFYKAHTTKKHGRPAWQPPRFKPALAWNYLLLALRKIRKQKGYSFINIAGLALGLACCTLILLWVKDELRYDRHLPNAGRIYRLAYSEEASGVADRMALVPYPAAPAFAAEIPEIEAYARLWRSSPLVVVEEKTFDGTSIYYTDPDFFKIFALPFLAGDPATALSAPGSIVLSEDTARRLFGRTDVMGKMLNFDRRDDLKVTGVLQSLPNSSHFIFDALATVATIAPRPEIRLGLDSWSITNGWSYLLLRKGAVVEDVNGKMPPIADKHSGQDFAATRREFWLQPVLDIHLRSHLMGEIGTNGDIRYVYIFAWIAAFILALACINFMNLATARSATRGKEIGLRKVLGAERKNLIVQFLGESVLTSVFASIGAIALVGLILPTFNRLTMKTLGFSALIGGSTWIGLAGLILMTGLISGSYPALVLSAFRPIAALRGTLGKSKKGASFRNVLVVFQFAVSIVLMAGTLILMQQMKFMKTRDLGFEKDRILTVRLRDAAVRREAGALIAELKRNPSIIEASQASGIPGRITQSMGISAEDRLEEAGWAMDVILSDYDFVKTFGISIARGRDFSKTFPSDAGGVFLVNETAARMLGWGSDTVGRKIGFDSTQLKEIVGVVKDFHYASLKDKIGPLIIALAPAIPGVDGVVLNLAARGNFLSLKVRGEIAGSVAFVQKLWTGRSERGFDYFFIDQQFNGLYLVEERIGIMMTIFSVLAVFIACLGLFGLASFAAVQRTKEIGIRKVLGATESGVAALLSKDFLKRVVLANIIALPASYWLLTKFWLSNFAYRTNPGIVLFAAVAGLSLLVALLTVIFQAVRAATSNPIDALRFE
jgi:putative ABC transport system permease protein